MTLAEIRAHAAHLWAAIEPYKPQLDVAFVGTLAVTLAGWVPHITAVVTLIWSLVRLYETKTVQGLLKARRRSKRRGG
jgi:hypothetical protein